MEFWNTIWNFIVDWIKKYLGINLILEAIDKGEPVPVQGWINVVFACISALLGFFILYKTLYIILGVFGKSRRFPSMPKDKKYAFILPAKDEELVIANLIENIRKMDYPQELIDCYVIADNCSDRTAEIARECGAYVFERHDPTKKRKGWALEAFFEDFKQTHDIEKDYYAYIILDADNIPATYFLEKMNDGLQSGKFDAAVGYRSAKNINENWVAAICALSQYSAVITGLRARSMLKTGQQLYGPSSTFRGHVLKNGWHWTTLTEDLDLEVDLPAEGYKVGYVEDAVIFEEQPTKVSIFIKQQMRWSRGNVQTFFKYTPKLIASWFKKPSWTKYDMYWQIFPYSVFTFYFSLLFNIVSLICFFIFGKYSYSWENFFIFLGTTILNVYLGGLFTTILTLIKEWKHIHLPFYKVMCYMFLFPIYQVINLPVAAVSVFMKVKWKHIDHHSVADASELQAIEEQKAKKSSKK